MTDLEACAATFQAEMTSARKTWDDHRAPLPATADPEETDMGAFRIDFPPELGRRAAIAEYLREVATRARTGQGTMSPPLTFLAELATAAEHGGPAEVSTAALSRDDQASIRRVLHIADQRAAMAEDGSGLAVIGFTRDLLAAWEQHIRYQAPRPGTRTGPYGEALRPGVPAPGRVAWD